MEIGFIVCLLSGHEFTLNHKVLVSPITVVALVLPAAPLTIVEFLNGPFTRQLNTCSHFLSFIGSQWDVQLLWTLFLLMSHNYEGRACLSNRRSTFSTFRCIILSILPEQSLREKESMLLHWEILQALFTLLSKAITDWPQMLIFSVVLGATRGLAHCLTNHWHLSVSNCALHPGCTRRSYVRIKTLFFSTKTLFKLKLPSG